MSRVPPHSEAAERASIGCMLLDGYRVTSYAMNELKLKPESWYVPAGRIVVEAVMAMAAEGQPIDTLTVAERLGADRLPQVGGRVWLDGCIDEAATVENAEYYLNIVRQKWVLRCVIGKAVEIEEQAFATENGDELLGQVPQMFVEVVSGAERVRSNSEVMDGRIQAWRDAHDKKVPAIGIRTPWDDLTELMCGLEPGITIVAGRPSAGKTTLEDMLSICAAMAGKPVARLSCDSSIDALWSRSLAREAGVSLPKLKFGYAGESNLASVQQAKEVLEKLPIHIADRIFDVRGVCTWARMMKARYDIAMLTIDYIQQLDAGEMGREAQNTVARVTYISRKIKHLSLELRIPVVVLSQLSREVEKENREPQLSDLRDSGAIEQDAEKVLFIYVDAKKRKAMEEAENGATKHKRPVWFNLMKHKDGETAALERWLYAPYFRFTQAGQDFADDKLPMNRQKTSDELNTMPDYWPRAEGEAFKPADMPDGKRSTNGLDAEVF